jgi:thymidylate synthase (FAD)
MNVLGEGKVDLIDYMGSDLTVVNSARVSFNKEAEWDTDHEAIERFKESGSHYTPDMVQKLSDKDVKLIRYLAKHKHWTPFSHPQITLRVKAPVSIRTQLFKHKVGLTENEVSRRYVKDDPTFYIPHWRTQPIGGAKQGSEDFLADKEKSEFYDEQMKNLCRYSFDLYRELIDNGIAPEQARFALPQAMFTEWYWTGSLAAFARVCSLRLDEHAQWEVRQYAKAIDEIVKPLFPVSWKYLCPREDSA